MFREWTCILLLIIFLTFSGPILCFNVNIKNAELFTGQRDSYFGFSLAFLDTQQGKWLLVGAPKAADSLQPAIQAPGGVYKCPLEGNSSSCSWVTIDQTGNQNVSGFYYGRYTKFSPHKSHQLLGMSIAVSPDSQYIMACAPNWKDAAHNLWLVSGMCYEVGTSGLGSTRLLPMLVDWSMSYLADSTRLWIYALLGFSVHYTQTSGSPVFGAPGMFSFTGGYVVEEDRERNTTVMPQQYTNSDSWFIGYALATTNRLDKSGNTYIVAGAPKGMMFGTVLVYLYKEKDSRVNNIIGEQISSYFGSVLCVADLNFDGLDDVIVGAPYFSGNKTEEGRVYVWMNKGDLRFEKQTAVLSGSLSRYARFGSALASIGDFNLDTYNDVAIGAPYEEDGVGALYIYNGYRQGLWPRFTQRISGSLLNPGLRAFGGSIGKDPLTSGTTKMFAVGAYDGDQALVLKSSSVVRVHHRVTVIPDVITHATPNVTATICFNYTTRFRDVPEVIEVDYSLDVDTLLGTGSSRSYISPDNVAHLDATVQVATTERCVDHTIITPFQDIEKDLVLRVRYDLSPSLTRQCTRYCLTMEAFNGADPTRVDNREVPIKIWFDKQCGPDNQCQPVLEIDVQPKLSGNATIIVGRDAALFADVTITNSGEMAYSIVVVVTVKARLSSPMRIMDTPGRLSLVDCVQTDRSADVNVSGDAYSCFVRRPYPLEDGKNITFSLKFPLENHIHLPTFEAKFSVHVGINATYQAGTELTIPILWSNSVKVESSSEPEDVPVRTDQARDMSTKIVHRYFVRNLGPSPIDGRHVLAFVPMPLTGNYITLDNDSVSITTYDSGPSQARSCSLDQNNATSPLENTVDYNLTCASAPCQRYICPIGMLLKDQSLLVTVRLSVMYSIMDRLKQDNTNVYLQTAFNFPKAHKGDDVNIQASTLFYEVSKALRQEETKVAVWPIIVGAIGALCLLVIAGAVMIKMGCFQRSNKEDMKKKVMTRMSQMYPDKFPRAPETTEASKNQPEELQND